MKKIYTKKPYKILTLILILILLSTSGCKPSIIEDENPGMNRDGIIKFFQNKSILTEFKKTTVGDGKESYIGKKGNCTIELIGPANKLTSATAVAYFGSNILENEVSLKGITGLAESVNLYSIRWLGKELEILSEKNQKDYSNSKKFGPLEYTIKLEIMDKFRTLTLEIKAIDKK